MSVLGRLPFDDYAEADPNALPFDQARTADACHGCNAEPGAECRPMCIGYAAHLDTL